MDISCPHCRSTIPLQEPDTEQVLCPSCGSTLELIPKTITSPGLGHDRVGRFVLLDELGVGAFGSVFKAQDPELNRLVAIKIPRPGSVGSRDAVERFVREARSVAQLRHPNIVPVHDVGERDGLPYLVSEYVEGVTLADWLSAHRPTFRQASELIVELADALDFAHRQGVVHRDVKPSNIMLDFKSASDSASTLSNVSAVNQEVGRPRLMDFGLAKRDAGEVTMTHEGQIIGTPAYMSPEQARGEGHRVDGRSDVYSLGVILYELLTGELPFRGNVRMLLHQVLHDEPRSPRRFNQLIPRDLETVCLKAMAKEPPRRYQTAGELAGELRRFLAGEPVLARPVGSMERAWRWCRRNPAMAALVTTVFVSLLAGSVVSTVLAIRAAHEAELARDSESRAETNARLAENKSQEAEEAALRSSASAEFAAKQRDLALDALSRLVDEVQQNLGQSKEQAAFRKHLLDSAAAALDSFSASAAQAPLHDVNQAAARQRLGNLYVQLGNYNAARREFRAALKVLDETLTAEPQNGDRIHLAGARVRGDLARVADILQDWDGVEREGQAQLAAASRLPGASADAKLQVLHGNFWLGRARLRRHDLAGSQAFFRRVLELRTALPAEMLEHRATQTFLATTFVAVGEACQQEGKLEEAEKHFQQAVDLCLAVVAAEPHELQAKLLGLQASVLRGGACEARGQDDQALVYYQSALAVYQRLPDDATKKTSIIDLCLRMAGIHARRQEHALVREYLYGQALSPALQLERVDPDNVQARHRLFQIYDRLGAASRGAGGWLGARHHYLNALERAKFGARATPESQTARYELIGCQRKLADVEAQLGLLDEARGRYVEAIELGLKNDSTQGQLSEIYLSLGSVLCRLGRTTEGCALFRKAIPLLDRRPNGAAGAAATRLLYLAYRELGQALQHIGQATEAEEALARALEYAQELKASAPNDALALGYLARAYEDLGLCRKQRGDFEAAIRWLSRAHDVWLGQQRGDRQLAEWTLTPLSGQLIPIGPAALGMARCNHNLALCRLADQVLAEPESARKQPAHLARDLLLLRVGLLSRQGKHAEAVKTVALLRDLAPEDPGNLFAVAQGFGICAPGAEGATARQDLAEQGLEALKDAISKGFRDCRALKDEVALASLRRLSNFAKFTHAVLASQQDIELRYIGNSLGMELAYLPPGSYRMGSHESHPEVADYFNRRLRSEFASYFQQEHPVHEVEITRPFYLGAGEVTVRQFGEFIRSTHYRTDAEREGTSSLDFNPTFSNKPLHGEAVSWQNAGQISEDEPVVYVSRNDAVAFCEWLSKKEGVKYRLPTEAEWEYACRAGARGRYWFGEDPESLNRFANVPDACYLSLYPLIKYDTVSGRDGFVETAPIGEFAANPFGLYDMHGNVWEWCLDNFDANYYAERVRRDPLCRRERDLYSLRGGCFM